MKRVVMGKNRLDILGNLGTFETLITVLIKLCERILDAEFRKKMETASCQRIAVGPKILLRHTIAV